MRARPGRECLYVPSCRLGLYVALRHWCEPGGKILMSPVNDDVILFVVLAAGLRPVQTPLSAADGSTTWTPCPTPCGTASAPSSPPVRTETPTRPGGCANAATGSASR